MYREIRVAAVDESDNVPEGSPPAQMNVFVTDGEFGPLPTPAPQRAPPTPPPPDNSAAIIGSAIGGVSKFYASPNLINTKIHENRSDKDTNSKTRIYSQLQSMQSFVRLIT